MNCEKKLTFKNEFYDKTTGQEFVLYCSLQAGHDSYHKTKMLLSGGTFKGEDPAWVTFNWDENTI